MTGITAQVSLYPFRREALAPSVNGAVRMLQESALVAEPGALSTLLVGSPATIFDALEEAFCHAAEQGQVVMVVTLSNAHTPLGD